VREVVVRKKLVVALLFVFSFSCIAHAAPKAVLWERWTANDPQSTIGVDHSAWGAFLGKYLVESEDGINRVAYGKVSDEDLASLGGYIEHLEAQPVSKLNRDEQRAFWINLYNALTVKVILDHYPVDSIREIKISPGLFSSGPWGKKLASVEGEELALDDIEHRVLRPIWKDPRIHYAVNCASLGCPNLQPVAFTAANTDELLERAATQYINHPRGVWFEGGKLKVSSIYKWFMSDFGGNHKGVIEHLKKYAAPELSRSLEEEKRFRGHAYDWSLNDAR
jgi:hypothetical protein